MTLLLLLAALVVVCLATRRGRLLVALALAGVIVLGTSTVAAAADTGLVVEGSSDFVITKPAWTIVTGLVLPFVIALVTKASASSTFKGVLGIVLAALAAIVERATLTDGSAVFTGALLLDILLVYGPQLLSYVGLWKNLDGGGLNARLAPRLGFG